MPLNRELLASLTFEPTGASDDLESSDSDHEPIAKFDEVDNEPDEDSGQNEATRLVISCLKIALAESIISISHPEKQRPLNPRSDFTIEATTEYTKQADSERQVGVSCCGVNSAQTKSRRRGDEVTANARRRRRSYNEMSSDRWGTAVDGDEPFYIPSGAAKAMNTGSGGSRGGGGPSRNRPGPSDTVSLRQRKRRSAALVGRSDIATVTEDDDYEEEEEDGEGPLVDFKFTDYSPMCYRHIREFFGVDPKEYCDVLRHSRWHSIPTPGKSAAQLFFCGRDWVIKTMTNQESEFLREILHRYYYHVRDNPYTLLPHFVGHHHLKIGTETHNFIIMQNVFATTNTIHEKFDLKGSTIGRFASEAEKLRATCTQKDLDIHRPLHIGPERRQLIIDQVKADCDFLKRSKIMDYSFLVGIHILPQKRPVVVAASRGSAFGGGTDSLNNAHTMASANANSSPFTQTLDAAAMTNRTFIVNAMQPGGTGGGGGVPPSADAPPLVTPRPQQQHQQPQTYFDGRCFTSDQGGMMSNDVPGLRREIYYIGIIDVLQEYNARKKMETAFFGAVHDFHRISCVNPNDYAARFISFMSSIIV